MIYHHFVEGSTPVLLLHSALGTHREMLPIAERFADRTVVLLDLPAHGSSSDLDKPFTSHVLGDWLSHEIHKEGWRQCDVIGYSLGGYVALESAITRTDESAPPIRSIVSHAMKFYWTDDAIGSAVGGMDFEALTNRSTRFIAALDSAHRVGAREVLAWVSRLISGFLDRQLSVEEIVRTGIPVLLTTGERDEMVTADEVNSLATSLREAGGDPREAILPGVQHPIKTLDLDAFERVVRDFWAETVK